MFDVARDAVAGDQNGAKSEGVGGNHHVEVAHRPPSAFESGTKIGVAAGGARIPRQGIDAEQEFLDGHRQSPRLEQAGDAEAKFRFGDGGDSYLGHRHAHEALTDGRNTALDSAAGDVRVEQVAGHFLMARVLVDRALTVGAWKSFRLWGGVSRRPPGKFSDTSTVFMRSKKSCQESGRRDRVTSPAAGLRRINTSEPVKRQLAGKRTARLRPLRKSLAVRGIGVSFAMIWIMIWTPSNRSRYRSRNCRKLRTKKRRDPDAISQHL